MKTARYGPGYDWRTRFICIDIPIEIIDAGHGRRRDCYCGKCCFHAADYSIKSQAATTKYQRCDGSGHAENPSPMYGMLRESDLNVSASTVRFA